MLTLLKKQLVLIMITVSIFSCSSEIEENMQEISEAQQSEVALNETAESEEAGQNPTIFQPGSGPNLPIPIPTVCEGYDIFANKEFDCGWKRGFDDYVFHYNLIVNELGLAQCFTTRTLQYSSGQIPTTQDPVPGKITLQSGSIPTGYDIPFRVRQRFANYINNLAANRNNNSFTRGQFAGYHAILGHVPLSANDPC